MQLLVAVCLLAAGVSAQGNYGESGIVYPDGTLVQFTREQADEIALIGPSGVVKHDGNHVQLNSDGVPARRRRSPQGNYGASGIVYPDGTLVQFTRDEADNIAVIGDSGVVKHDGNHVQLNSDGVPARRRRSPSQVLYTGPSGVIFKGGESRHLPRGASVVLEGPSGAVLSTGVNVQYRPKRSPSQVLYTGPAGVHFKDGQKRHLPVGVSIAVEGPSGAVLSNGDNVQYRRKRGIPVVGEAGIITSTGKQIQFPLGVKVLIQGDTGVLLSNGEALQLYE